MPLTLRPFRIKVWMLLVLPFIVAIVIVVPREIDSWMGRRAARRDALRYAEWRDRYAILIKADRGPVPKEKLEMFHDMCSVLAIHSQHMADGGSIFNAPKFYAAEPPEPPPVEPGSRESPEDAVD